MSDAAAGIAVAPPPALGPSLHQCPPTVLHLLFKHRNCAFINTHPSLRRGTETKVFFLELQAKFHTCMLLLKVHITQQPFWWLIVLVYYLVHFLRDKE